jgi:hypothetical protein
MGCCQNNVSMLIRFMNTLSERVHAVDMKEQTKSIARHGRDNRTYLRELRYGG